jgi:hypothetical protein
VWYTSFLEDVGNMLGSELSNRFLSTMQARNGWLRSPANQVNDFFSFVARARDLPFNPVQRDSGNGVELFRWKRSAFSAAPKGCHF